MTTLRDVDKILSRGGVCILPTETVYGIGGRADRRDAIDRIYAAKGRRFDKPLAICVRNEKMAAQYGKLCPLAQALIAAFWPGPLTIVVEALKTDMDRRLYGNPDSDAPTIALRCPAMTWAHTLSSLPLALTSANRSGDPETYTASEASHTVGDFVDGVLDGGRSAESIPSTILAITDGKAKLLRRGALEAHDFAPLAVDWV